MSLPVLNQGKTLTTDNLYDFASREVYPFNEQMLDLAGAIVALAEAVEEGGGGGSGDARAMTNQEIDDVLESVFDPPKGATVTPTDSVVLWLNCADEYDLGYSTMSEILDDSTIVEKLMSTNNACDYLARSTTFVTDICADENAMTEIGNNQYCRDVLFSNATWHSALLASPYASLYKTTPSKGATVSPLNDATTWMECIGEFDSEYTTLSSILSDSTTLGELMSDNNACDYLVRSTDWVTAICANQTAMSYIGLNAYCIEKMLKSTAWRAGISNSTYCSSAFPVKVPTMTSNIAPSGTVSAHSTYSSYQPWRAFRGGLVEAIGWWSNSLTNPWIQYQFTSPVRIVELVISNICHASYLNSGINEFTLQYSDDGTNFTDFYSDTATKATSGNQNTNQHFRLKLLDEGHTTWRISCKSNHGNASLIGVSAIQLLGIE